MTADSEQRRRQLRRLYALVPVMLDCKGLCADSCRSPLDVSEMEAERIHELAGEPIVPGDGERACNMLNADGRCSVYRDRPMLCRMFGASVLMPCEHGCEPAVWLDEEETIALLAEAFNVGGDPRGGEPLDVKQIRRCARANPGMMFEVLAAFRSGNVPPPP